MASIEMTPALSEAVRLRLTKEYADVCAANFALDILVEALQVEIQKVRDHNEALLERIRKQDETIEAQKLDLGSRGALIREKVKAHKKAAETTDDENAT